MLNTAMNLDLVLYLSLSIYSFGSGRIFVIFNVISMYISKGEGITLLHSLEELLPGGDRTAPSLARPVAVRSTSSHVFTNQSNTVQHIPTLESLEHS